MIETAQQSENSYLKLIEKAEDAINIGCQINRQIWYFFSFIAILINSTLAGLAFWLGLKTGAISQKQRVPVSDVQVLLGESGVLEATKPENAADKN